MRPPGGRRRADSAHLPAPVLSGWMSPSPRRRSSVEVDTQPSDLLLVPSPASASEEVKDPQTPRARRRISAWKEVELRQVLHLCGLLLLLRFSIWLFIGQVGRRSSSLRSERSRIKNCGRLESLPSSVFLLIPSERRRFRQKEDVNFTARNVTPKKNEFQIRKGAVAQLKVKRWQRLVMSCFRGNRLRKGSEICFRCISGATLRLRCDTQ